VKKPPPVPPCPATLFLSLFALVSHPAAKPSSSTCPPSGLAIFLHPLTPSPTSTNPSREKPHGVPHPSVAHHLSLHLAVLQSLVTEESSLPLLFNPSRITGVYELAHGLKSQLDRSRDRAFNVACAEAVLVVDENLRPQPEYQRGQLCRVSLSPASLQSSVSNPEGLIALPVCHSGRE
jgi:hypothetical protein